MESSEIVEETAAAIGLKKKLLYNRQRTYSDGNLNEIMDKSPSKMNDKEKAIWKFEIFR